MPDMPKPEKVKYRRDRTNEYARKRKAYLDGTMGSNSPHLHQIVRCIEVHGMSQAATAKRLGIKAVQVSIVYRGYRIRRDRLFYVDIDGPEE